MNGEPTIVIHNYAGGGGGPEEISMGAEVSRYTPDAEYQDWMWGPSPTSGGDAPTVDFRAGKTYVIYELPNG